MMSGGVSHYMTMQEKQRYLQQTEEMGVELRSQEHAIELLEEGLPHCRP